METESGREESSYAPLHGYPLSMTLSLHPVYRVETGLLPRCLDETALDATGLRRCVAALKPREAIDHVSLLLP